MRKTGDRPSPRLYLWLAVVDLHLRRRSAMMQLPVLLYAPVLGLLLGVQTTLGWIPVAPAFASWDFSRLCAYDDDTKSMLEFQRPLPIDPSMIVGMRYLQVLLALPGFVLFGLLTILLLPSLRYAVEPRIWVLGVALPTALGLISSALFNAFYFRFGYRAVSTFLPYLVIPLGALVILLLSPVGKSAGVRRSLHFLLDAGKWVSTHPEVSMTVMMLFSILTYAGSWAWAASGLRQRET